MRFSVNGLSRLFGVACCVCMVLATSTVFAQRGSSARVDAFTKDTNAKIEEIFESIEGKDSVRDAYREMARLGDTVSQRMGARQLNAMVNVEGAIGMIAALNATARARSVEGLPESIELFLEHRVFMTELGLLFGEKDQPFEVIRVATELMKERSQQVQAYPQLAAAICVVHDRRASSSYTVRVNENNPVASSPIEIFDFFTGNAGSMHIPLDRTPASLLVFVVDVTETPEQLQWALDRYRTNPAVDQRFFEIEYDYDHYLHGKTKKVTSAGNYSLTQIQKHGGVCADQAYYAMSVAKACGIPSGYVVAKGADLSHAWVGYLETKGRRGAWNFDAGRYEDYQNLRGNIVDPQSGEKISDGRLGILGNSFNSTNEQVLQSIASARVVERMNNRQWNPDDELALDTKGNNRKLRTAEVADRLMLLKQTLGKCAGSPIAWDQVTAMGEKGLLDQKQMDVWARAVMQMAGRTHQDFSYDFLVDLIATIEDPQQQHDMWEWAFGQFRTRPDLAAGVRFMQGSLWEANENPEFAWIAYQDVLNNFLNDGPMTVDALTAIGRMLAKNGKRKEVYLGLLQEIARKVQRPDEMASNFAKQSNYYKVNWKLVKELEYHDRQGEADQLRKLIDMPASE